MKSTRLLAFPAIILAIAVCAFAFRSQPQTTASKKAPLQNEYFVYMGGGESTASNYNKVTDLPEDCGSGTAICAILAPEDNSTGHPLISSQLQQRIDNRTTTSGDVFVKP